MAKRRSSKITFDVNEPVQRMERAVMYRMVERDYTANDVLEWCVPAHELAALRSAFPFAQDGGYGTWDVRFPMANTTICLISLNAAALKCLRPHDRRWIGDTPTQFQDTAKGDTIRASLEHMHQIKHDFDVIREIVKWMNDAKVTPGWARHYAPWLGGMLPAAHAIHLVDGSTFKETYLPHAIADKMRRAPEIVTRGLLAGDAKLDGQCIGHVQIGGGQRLNWFTL